SMKLIFLDIMKVHATFLFMKLSNYEDVLNFLHTTTSDEEFYKNLYEAEKNNVLLRDFLSKISREKVKKEKLIVPEWEWTMKGRDIREPSIFKENQERNVFLSKHQCYTPIFTHSHSLFEFIYVIDGKCRQNIKGISFDMKEGDFLLISPEVSHSIAVFDESTVINIIIKKSNFDNAFFNFLRNKNIISQFCSRSLYKKYAPDYLLFHTGKDEELKNLVLEMFMESVNEDDFDLELLDYQVAILFTKILKRYGSSCVSPANSRKTDKVASEIMEYIQENFAEISLSDIAQRFHYNKDYTSRLIKKISGMTLQQLLLKMRMSRACCLLIDTDMPVEEISSKVGYFNVENFIRMFHKTFEMSPRQYRKLFSS
nr:AraC family transcriptional regulator [Treponema sp.]